ncbi:polysaccharide biosynthesis C-terminal domain-containing protein [Salinibaculum salinum]|uniref:oligosaccharide flippase family protein n=1 Tax=Salinibaculum salinum TaxID=3131996 RepID=UPI0030ECEADD
MRIGQTSFITFISKFVSSIAGFVATILFARLLGAEVLGTYYLLLSIVAWLALVGTLGFESAITKRLSEGTDRGAYKIAGGLCIATLTSIIVVVLILGEGFVVRLFSVQNIDYVVLLLLVGVAGTYVDSVLQGYHLVHIYAILRPIRRVIRTILQVSGVLLSLGLLALVGGYAAGGIIVVLIGLFIIGGPYTLPGRHHFHSLFDYAKYAWMGRLEGKTFNQADILILGIFVPDSLVGIYGITWSLANFLVIFSNAISSALFPELSKLSSEDEYTQVASLVSDSMAYAGLFTIPGVVGGGLLSESLLRVYGPEFVEGARVLTILIVAVLFYGYQRQTVNALSGIDRPDEAFTVNSVLIGSNVVLNIVLIANFGIIGAAVATATSAVISLVTGYIILRRHVIISLPIRRIGTQIIAATGMGVVVIVVEEIIKTILPPTDVIVPTGLIVGVGAVSYFSFLWILSAEFREVVIENAPLISS